MMSATNKERVHLLQKRSSISAEIAHLRMSVQMDGARSINLASGFVFVHLNTMGLSVIRRFQITVQISRQLYSRAQENVSVKNPFVLATKLAVTRISRLTTTVEDVSTNIV